MKIAITTNEGVQIMTLLFPMQIAKTLEKWAQLNSGYVSHRVIEEADIPADRAFRNAWEDSGLSIDVNMDKARHLHCDRLRAMRKPLLAVLDIEYQRADESGDQNLKSEIAAKKQALRDVTKDPMIEAAKTPEELKLAIPSVLTE